MHHLYVTDGVAAGVLVGNPQRRILELLGSLAHRRDQPPPVSAPTGMRRIIHQMHSKTSSSFGCEAHQDEHTQLLGSSDVLHSLQGDWIKLQEHIRPLSRDMCEPHGLQGSIINSHTGKGKDPAAGLTVGRVGPFSLRGFRLEGVASGVKDGAKAQD